MGDRLAGKTAMVTAAAQGIGRATTLALADQGVAVWATDINTEKLGELADVAGVTTRRLDVCDNLEIDGAAKELGALDVLVNCAGTVAHGSILECTPEDWDQAFAVNVTSMFRLIQDFLPAMLDAGSGSIVNISSVASSVMGVANRCAYGASKAAVIGLTKSVASDFVSRGIRCNAICPGTVDTPSLQERIAGFDDPVAARQAFIDRQPIGRLGTAEEVAALCIYLGGDESGYTTGTIHVIDGGMSL